MYTYNKLLTSKAKVGQSGEHNANIYYSMANYIHILIIATVGLLCRLFSIHPTSAIPTHTHIHTHTPKHISTLAAKVSVCKTSAWSEHHSDANFHLVCNSFRRCRHLFSFRSLPYYSIELIENYNRSFHLKW